ncbi:putative phage-type endonuclease [Phaeobacter inhibens]|uniref:lambda exonuclease family protein n=1 Tax=Phaeobacter inhibens TaxID=221822 RepID=UPI000C9A4232|nr:lambda exonuclease family protein [Phaeobacter inhibens]AUR11182.1 putative phage-type endonuclease [Phaeobacter inhibens]
MIEQGGDEWHQMRLGKVTASKVNDAMMDKSKAGYQNYRAQLVCERLTGRTTETFKSAAMDQGNETEPQARAMYTMTTGQMVEQVAFADHPAISMAGASPDGLVGELGLVEIKCPQPTEHIRVLTGGAIKKAYREQMQWQMACTGREWCDFVSFCPDLPDDLALHILRIDADPEAIRDMETAVRAFLRDVEAMTRRLTEKAAA